VSDARTDRPDSSAEPPAPEELSAKRTSGGGLGETGGSPSAHRDVGNREVPPPPTARTADEKRTTEAREPEEPTTEEAREPDEQSLEDRLQALTAERDEYLDDLRRVAAEFENYRKRTAREQVDMTTRANERLVKALLPVIDDLERALEAAQQHEEAKLEEGVRLVHRSLADLLGKEGLTEIDANGRFDPHVHEALLAQPSEAEEGSVIQVLQKGYRLGDRVLRPARVVVAGPPAGDA
jgi:molecular chaperone GrpE